jgi:hypothetical protein
MRKITIVVCLVLMTFVIGCTTAPNQRACTEDAKLCSDGTPVERDPNNNCEFFECSNEKPIPVEPDGGIGTTNNREYISQNQTQCAATTWICDEGMQQFYDETGCGCE